MRSAYIYIHIYIYIYILHDQQIQNVPLKNNYIFHDQQLQNVPKIPDQLLFESCIYMYVFAYIYMCVCQCISAKSDRCFIIIVTSYVIQDTSKSSEKEPFLTELIDMVPRPFLRYELNSGYVMPKKTAMYIYQ